MALMSIQIIGEISDSEDNQRDFNRYANYVGNLYFNALPKLNIQYLKKIVVELLYNSSTNNSIIPYSKDFVICTIQQRFDFSSFLQKDCFLRKRYLTELLHLNILKLAKEFNWELDPFVSAYEKIKETNYESHTVVGVIKKSKDRKYRAGIAVEQDIESASIYIFFLDSNESVIEKMKVFETLPQPFLYMQLIGKSKWLNDGEFVLYNKSKEVRIIASILDAHLSVMYTPKGREVEGVKEELKFIAKGNTLPNWFG
ncbi:MAG: hypothetical protein ACI9K1_001423 [Arcticibacterium sp.]|jgi:hypothetical protein